MNKAETIKMMDDALEKGYDVEVTINGEVYEYKDDKVCCICGRKIRVWGNDPWPLNTDEDAVCCDECDMSVVLAARIRKMRYEVNN